MCSVNYSKKGYKNHHGEVPVVVQHNFSLSLSIVFVDILCFCLAIFNFCTYACEHMFALKYWCSSVATGGTFEKIMRFLFKCCWIFSNLCNWRNHSP